MKKLIHDGKLEVRVYLGERLHAKAYILMAKNTFVLQFTVTVNFKNST